MPHARQADRPCVACGNVAVWHCGVQPTLNGEWQIVTIAASFNQLPFPNHIAHCIISAAIAINKEDTEKERERERTGKEEQKQQKGK